MFICLISSTQTEATIICIAGKLVCVHALMVWLRQLCGHKAPVRFITCRMIRLKPWGRSHVVVKLQQPAVHSQGVMYSAIWIQASTKCRMNLAVAGV